jgi:hypothetical protein
VDDMLKTLYATKFDIYNRCPSYTTVEHVCLIEVRYIEARPAEVRLGEIQKVRDRLAKVRLGKIQSTTDSFVIALIEYIPKCNSKFLINRMFDMRIVI